MSDVPHGMADVPLDMREQLIRIDRAIAETREFQDEATKLRAEGQKLRIDRFLAPVALIAALVGAMFAAFGPSVIRAFTGHYP